jgi:hypothetical protein
MKILFVAMFLLTSFTANAADVRERYYVEGIIADKDHPGQSLAVINGTTYRTGDSVDDYTLAQVFSNGAMLKHKKTQEEKTLLIGRDTPPSWLVQDNYVFPDPKEGESEAPNGSLGSLLNPFGALQKAKEAAALARLQQLKIALEAYHSESDRYPESLEELTQKGYIEKSMYQGWEDYQFLYHVKNDGKEFSLYVEPVRSEKMKRFFYTDETGMVRSELGIQAGKDSPTLSNV